MSVVKMSKWPSEFKSATSIPIVKCDIWLSDFFTDSVNVLSLLFLSFGDTFAAIIGKKIPYIKLGKKTISGSIAGFFACLAIGLIIDIPINYGIIIFGAFLAMFIEILPLPVNDNVSIPIISGLSMYYFSLIIWQYYLLLL